MLKDSEKQLLSALLDAVDDYSDLIAKGQIQFKMLMSKKMRYAELMDEA